MCALLPEAVSAGSVLTESVTPSGALVCVDVGTLCGRDSLVLEPVTECHVLECVAYLMGYGAAHGLAGAGINPERANHIVISATCGKPL